MHHRRCDFLSINYILIIIPQYPSLVLVQPRKTRPYITERLLMGRKESKQTNKQTNHSSVVFMPTKIQLSQLVGAERAKIV